MRQITTNCATNETPTEHSIRKEVWTSAEESFELSQCSRQAETTSTRPAVIDTTRQRQNRQDHEDGHRYCGGNTRQAIDKLGPVELVRRPTHSTGHVPTEYIRPATIHQKQPPRLHLTAKRRTTFNVQPLRKGSVDHKRLRNDEHRFPLRHWKVFTKTFEFHICFSSVCGWCRNRGSMLDDFRIETLH